MNIEDANELAESQRISAVRAISRRGYRVPIPEKPRPFSVESIATSLRKRTSSYTWRELAKDMYGSVPGFRWMRYYSPRQSLQGDVVAGLAVGVMTIPLSVAFASMAGLPAAFGLYTCLAPSIAFGLFGGSRHLSVGPVALVSLLLGDGLGGIVPGSEENPNPNKPQNFAVQAEYNRTAVQVSLLVGLIYVMLHRLRLGFVCNLLSRPIISSFVTAGATIISLSQLKYILGFDIPPGNKLHVLLANLGKNLPKAQWPEILMGSFWILLLWSVRKAGTLHRWLVVISSLGPVFTAAFSIAIVWGGDLQRKAGIKVIGFIQPGLMPFTVSWWLPMENFLRQLTLAAAITLVSLLEAISIAKALGEKHGDRIDPSIEIQGLAASNLAGAAFGAYPSTGSFARSAVCSDSGGQTGLSGFIAAAVVGCTLLFLTQIFEHMPMNAMAAIVIMGVLGLLDFRRALFYFKVSKLDFFVWLGTFLAALFLGIDLGLAIGIGLSLLFLFARLAFAEAQVLAAVPGSTGEFQPQAEIERCMGYQHAVTNGVHPDPDPAHPSTADHEIASDRRSHLRGGRATAEEAIEQNGGESDQDALLQKQGEGPVASASPRESRSGRVLIFRPAVPLCFANIQSFQDQVEAEIGRLVDVPKAEINEHSSSEVNDKESGASMLKAGQSHQRFEESSTAPDPELGSSGGSEEPSRSKMVLILDFSCSAFVDATAVEKLIDWQSKLKQRGIYMLLAAPSPQVVGIFDQSGLLQKLGKDAVYWRVQDAVLDWSL